MQDPSQPLPNARHEAFALAWAGDRVSAATAYALAGYKPDKDGSHAGRLARNGQIKARKAWLQRQTATAATLTQIEKRELLAAIARGGKDCDRIAAMKLDNDLAGDGAEAAMAITITRAWK